LCLSAVRARRYLSLHLYGQGFGEFEAEGGLGGEDDLLVPGVGRSRGSRASTHCCTNQGSFSATGKTSDEGPTSGAAANHGGSTLPFALEVAADRTSFHVVTVSVHRDGLEDKPEYGGTLKACLAAPAGRTTLPSTSTGLAMVALKW